jgi:hypothetical protein
MLRYTYTNNNGVRQITVVLPGLDVVTVDDTHANFSLVLNAARAGDEAKVYDYLDLDAAYRDALANVGNDFAYENKVVTYKGEPVSDALNKVIIDVLVQKGDVTSFARFAERIAANPSYNSRKATFDWIQRHGLTINEDGWIIAYKGVTAADNGDYVSITHGEGAVNGVDANGALRNNVGDVVTVPRHKVDDNINTHCSFGLHAGTFSYASGFARGVLLTVKIDPADVVSIPNDGHKIRCCRYEVLATTETAWTASVVWDGVSEDNIDADWSDDQDDDYWGEGSY